MNLLNLPDWNIQLQVLADTSDLDELEFVGVKYENGRVLLVLDTVDDGEDDEEA
jgi:hypothetical protein